MNCRPDRGRRTVCIAGGYRAEGVTYGRGYISAHPLTKDGTMKNRCTLLAACMLCLGLAACGGSPLLAPEAPRFDGGFTAGSGNRAVDTMSVASPTETTDGGLITTRGGSTIGTGH